MIERALHQLEVLGLAKQLGREFVPEVMEAKASTPARSRTRFQQLLSHDTVKPIWTLDWGSMVSVGRLDGGKIDRQSLA